MAPWARWVDALWRATLFVVLVLAMLVAGVQLLPFLRPSPLDERLFSPAVLGQFGLALLAALVATWIMVRLVDRRSDRGAAPRAERGPAARGPAGPGRALGFPLRRDVPLRLGLGVLAGAAAPAVAVLALALTGAYRYGPEAGSVAGWAWTALHGLLVLAIPAAAEEAIFRGYPFRVLVRGAGPIAAVVLTSAAFAWVHGHNPGVGALAFVNIFLAGVALAYAALRTGALWLATAVHLGWNWALAVLLDLPVSGLEPFDPPLYDAAPTGPDWLTGGAFGPEGGLAGTMAAVVVIVLIGWLTRPGAVLAPAAGAGEAVGEGERDERVDD